jgi:hypothetical protein
VGVAQVTNSSLAYADPVELSAFVALKRPAPTEVIEYGTAPSQAVDLFLPTGDGPHPLAMLNSRRMLECDDRRA